MKKMLRIGLVSIVVFGGWSGSSFGADQDRDRVREHVDMPEQDMLHEQLRTQDRIRDQDIYGYHMMSSEEMERYRETMRELKTEEERERFRDQHHELMEQRQRERHQERQEVMAGPMKPEHMDRPETPARPDRPQSPERPEKPDSGGMHDRPERPDMDHGRRR